LTRAEREAIALKKREEEVAKQREEQKALLERRKAFIQDGKRIGSKSALNLFLKQSSKVQTIGDGFND
uniref:Troponin T n=1 Tax=Gongylonema pulchrum TaxID=637853 RepID=A0A183DHL9_9BILA